MRQTEFFVILDHFLPFHCHPDNMENQIFEKSPGSIIILRICTINDNHIMYVSWRYGVWQTKIFIILDGFLLFYAPNNINYQNFEKNEKNTRRYYHFKHVYHNDYHLMYSSWIIEPNGQHFLSFWTIFCPFTLLTTKKIKTLKKWKKRLDISSFCKCVS